MQGDKHGEGGEAMESRKPPSMGRDEVGPTRPRMDAAPRGEYVSLANTSRTAHAGQYVRGAPQEAFPVPGISYPTGPAETSLSLTGRAPVRSYPSAGYVRSAAPAPGARERHGIPWYGWAIGVTLGVLLLATVGCCAVSGLFVGLFNHSGETETVTRTFAVSGTPSLAIQNPAGNVVVSQGTSDEVVVQATKRVREPFLGDPRTVLNAMQVQMGQSGNTVTVTVRLPNPRGVGDRAVDLDITTPPSINLTANASAGNLTLSSVSGQFDVTASAGNVDASGMTFSGSSHITDRAGNVTLDGTVADNSALTVMVNAGNVTLRLPADTPAHLSARASAGTVTVSGWPINVTQPSVASALAVGDLGPSPTSTITIVVDAGNAAIEAR